MKPLRFGWSGSSTKAACVAANYRALIEQLPCSKRFAFVVEDGDGTDPDNAEIVASGVEETMAAAQISAEEVLMELVPLEVVHFLERSGTNIVDFFPYGIIQN